MDFEMSTFMRTSRMLAILGALIYAIGAVLLSASKASLTDYPDLGPYAK
jgi:hypothetical protein